MDPVHDIEPVRRFRALQGTIRAVEEHARQIVKNERQARIQDADGVLKPSRTRVDERDSSSLSWT